MALPVCVVEDAVADEFVALMKQFATERVVGAAYDPGTELGPVVSAAHQASVKRWIDKGVEEGAELVLDGRDLVVPGLEGGHFVGPTIFDHVTPEMSCGWEEAFGPVLFIKRVADFEEGLALMNHSEFANGSCIFTESGYYSREFARRTHAGMVGINVGIPVPVSFFPFAGHKDSLLRRQPRAGQGRRAVLHRDQVRHHALVHGGRQEAEADQHLGGHRQPLSRLLTSLAPVRGVLEGPGCR